MGYSDRKKPLFRKVNTRTIRVRYHTTGDARHDRNTKDGLSKSMQSKEHPLDFTPLFMFLLSKIGQPWDEVHSEAVSRIPKEHKDAVNWMFKDVSNSPRHLSYFRGGESSYYSTLIVDENGLIQKASDINNIDLYPSCWCCTHTFNGKPLTNKWENHPANIKTKEDGISG